MIEGLLMFFVLTVGLGAVWSLAGCSCVVRLIVLFGFGHYLIEKNYSGHHLPIIKTRAYMICSDLSCLECGN